MRTNSLLRRVFLVASTLAASSGCECFSSAPLRDLSKMQPGETVSLFVREEAAVATLQGEVKSHIDSPERSGTLYATILVRRPHSFRMRAYPPIMGGTVFDLSIRKEKLEFYVPSEETVFAQRLGGPKPSPRAAPGGQPGTSPQPSPGGEAGP